MAKLFYQLGGGGGTILNVFDDPQVLVEGDLQTEMTTLQTIKGLSDPFRTSIAQAGIPSLGVPGGWPSLEAFDTYIDEALQRLQDILDYFGYEGGTANISVRTTNWFVPEAIESVTDENIGAEATLAIDGIYTTWWQSDAPGERKIIFRVRDYKKKFLGLRLRATAGDDRTWLQDVTISGSVGIAMIDDPGNVIDTDVDFDYAGNAWMEVVFSAPKTAKFLQLAIPTSTAGDTIRIRGIEVQVGIINHEL